MKPKREKIKLELDKEKKELIPLRPIRDGKEGYIRYVNENYPHLDITEKIEDYKKNNEPSVPVWASDEEILKKYLQSIFRQSFDDDAEFYGRLALHEFQYTYARDTCQKLGFMAGSRITDKGVEFLKYLQQKEIQNKQNKINWWLVVVTGILAISTILQVLILLLK